MFDKLFKKVKAKYYILATAETNSKYIFRVLDVENSEKTLEFDK